MPNKTIDEVKAALQCCIVHEPDYRRRCPECPYRDPEAYCANRLMADALTSIETLSTQLEAAMSAINGDGCESCGIEEG